MIDDYAETFALIEKMKRHLPIPAHPTEQFIRFMKENKIKFNPEQDLVISDVLYLGDEGGIGCAISRPKDTKSAVISSITHLQIKPGHPLAKEIFDYQKRRKKKLAQGESKEKPNREKRGRNDPCPCGSGKKYKKCCGK